MSIKDADVVAHRLTRQLATFAEAQSAALDLDMTPAINAAIEVALAEVEARDLVAALASHVISLAAMTNPEDPESMLDALAELTTTVRLDPDLGGDR